MSSSQLSTTDSQPLLGTGPDLELDNLPSDFAPPILRVPANDYSQVVRQLDDMQSRIDRLRATARFLDRSATVAFLKRFTAVT